MIDWGAYLINAIETSDVKAVSRLRSEGPEGERAWNAHLSLFPAVQRVLNPPFINPHLPKMYAVCRDLFPYMEAEDVPRLLYMETAEYARRKKLDTHPPAHFDDTNGKASVPFAAVQEAIRSGDVDETASLFLTFLRQHGARELGRRLLLLGSGYLVESLGHSISCTAFILREMLARTDQDLWPALVLLADYFIKGRFDATPPLQRSESAMRTVLGPIMHTTSGSSFIDIHHTITLYAIGRTRELFTQEEYEHLISQWLGWMGEKKSDTRFEVPKQSSATDYVTFYKAFSALDVDAVLKMAVPLTTSPDGRMLLGRFLVRGLCALYQGNYDPHYVTGLGAALWITATYPDQPSFVSSALHQYVSFLFRGLAGT